MKKIILLMLILCSCKTVPVTTDVPVPSPIVPPEISPTPTPIGEAGPGALPMAWKNVAWSTELLKQIDSVLPKLELASDLPNWCPNYPKLGKEDRKNVWATLMIEIARYESNFKPGNKYFEKTMGYDSIGLFQLSYPDKMSWCQMSAASGNLVDPIVNIQCAVPKMGQLIARDKVISVGNKGLAAYWSTIRAAGDHQYKQIKQAVLALSTCQIGRGL